ALPAVRHGAPEAAGRDRQGSPLAGRQRRALREDPYLQLQGEPHHRSPDRLHDAPAPGGARRRSRRTDRRCGHALHVGKAERSDRRRSVGLMPTLREVVARGRETLAAAGIAADEAALDAELLARHVLGWDRARLVANGRDEAPATFEDAYSPLITRRASREPIAYITGHREFWGL